MKPVRLAAVWLAVPWLAVCQTAGVRAGQIYVVPLDGSAPPRRVSPEVAWDCGSPNWSPDGRRLAYDSWPSVENFGAAELRVVNADGTGLVRLCEGSVPSWSADGTLIAFHAYRPQQRIGVVNADGTGEETLFYGAWSPRWVDGKSKIAAIDRVGLLIHDLRTDSARRVPPNARLRPGFSYSPKADRFAAAEHVFNRADRGYRLHITSASAADFEARVLYLTRGNRRIGQVSWGPNGRSLVLAIGDIDVDCRLFLIDVDRDQQPTPLNVVPDDWIACNPSWSPDGEWIAFVRMGDEQDPPPLHSKVAADG